MSIHKVAKNRYVVRHKYGGLMGTFKSKAAALAQNRAVHAAIGAAKKKKKGKKAKKKTGKKKSGHRWETGGSWWGARG